MKELIPHPHRIKVDFKSYMYRRQILLTQRLLVWKLKSRILFLKAKDSSEQNLYTEAEAHVIFAVFDIFYFLSELVSFQRD